MDNRIPPERLELLTELGFGDTPDCDPSYAFGTQTLALDTKMGVRGDHAEDRAYVYYARTEVDGEVLDGFFFAPSMMDYLNMMYGNSWDFAPLMDKINGYIGGYGRYVGVGGFPMLYVEVFETDWKNRDLRDPLSEILKLVGISDYVLGGELERLRKGSGRG